MEQQAKFAASKDEFKLITEIAHRASTMAAGNGIEYRVMDAAMDIEATHCSGNPLRLAELAAADQVNFSHDVFGIRRHLNRETGQLEDCFSPRYSAPVKVAA